MQKMEKETGEDSGKDSRDFRLYEIFGTVADCPSVLFWSIWKSAGNQPVGCIFHDPCRKLPSGRLWDRSCSPDSSDGWHVCTGKILLQVLLPYGSSIFSASGAAFFLPFTEREKTAEKDVKHVRRPARLRSAFRRMVTGLSAVIASSVRSVSISVHRSTFTAESESSKEMSSGLRFCVH